MQYRNSFAYTVLSVALLAIASPVHAQTKKAGEQVPHEFLVQFKEAPTHAAVASLSSAGVARHNYLSRSAAAGSRRTARWVRVVLDPKTDSVRAMKRLAVNPAVARVVPNTYAELYATPNDPMFSSQWNLENTGQTGGTPGADASLTGAWDITTGGGNVVVAITDTGVEWGRIMAMGTLIVIPPLLFTFFAARQIIQGMTAGAVKG